MLFFPKWGLEEKKRNLTILGKIFACWVFSIFPPRIIFLGQVGFFYLLQDKFFSYLVFQVVTFLITFPNAGIFKCDMMR